jgi:hypothetical protein
MSDYINELIEESMRGPSPRWNGPPDGSSNIIRIAPGRKRPDGTRMLPFVRRYAHWNILDKGLVNAQHPDRKVDRNGWPTTPASRVGDVLLQYAKRLPKGDQLIPQIGGYPHNGIASKLNIDFKAYCNVVVIRPDSKDDPTMQFWPMPWGAYKLIMWEKIPAEMELARARGQDWDMFHPEKGNNITARYNKGQGRDTWKISIDSVETPFPLENWEGELHDLEAMALDNLVEMGDNEMVEILSTRYDPLLGQLKIPNAGSVKEICS